MTNAAKLCLISIFLLGAGAHALVCDSAGLKTAKANFFGQAKTVWISLNNQVSMRFQDMGFKPVAPDAAIKTIVQAGAGNTVQCPDTHESSKIYSSRDGLVAFFTSNGCQEKLATSLGMQPAKVLNYGSMEVGVPLPLKDLGICKDGASLKACPPSDKNACTKFQ